MSDFQLVHGDCRDALQAMAAESIDAIVCDPPYHLTQVSRGGSPRSNGGAGPFSRHKVGATGFMGQTWDGGDVAFDPDTWADCYRVLKDGGRMLVFGGARTHHRIWCAIEDGGFLIEDTMMWLYGSGFPKHRSKLKPAFEPICVARKGGATDLNIDDARLPVTDADRESWKRLEGFNNTPRTTGNVYAGGKVTPADDRSTFDAIGRWPANVALDVNAAMQLDEQSGTLTSGANPTSRNSDKTRNVYGAFKGEVCIPARGIDIGGASRFYYCAKPDRAERDTGLEKLPKQQGGSIASGMTADRERGVIRSESVHNTHPTVKPVDLMRWLVRLITREGECVLDPFMGSGTTGVACVTEGRSFIGVELNEEYIDIARHRIAAAPLNLFAEGA